MALYPELESVGYCYLAHVASVMFLLCLSFLLSTEGGGTPGMSNFFGQDPTLTPQAWTLFGFTARGMQSLFELSSCYIWNISGGTSIAWLVNFALNISIQRRALQFNWRQCSHQYKLFLLFKVPVQLSQCLFKLRVSLPYSTFSL